MNYDELRSDLEMVREYASLIERLIDKREDDAIQENVITMRFYADTAVETAFNDTNDTE